MKEVQLLGGISPGRLLWPINKQNWFRKLLTMRDGLPNATFSMFVVKNTGLEDFIFVEVFDKS